MTDTQITLSLDAPRDLQTHYARALYHLEKAVQVDEVMTLRDEAEQLKLLGKQANDRTAMANAVELAMRAEHKLGTMLAQAKAAGLLHKGGRPGKKTPADAAGVLTKVSLEEAGISWKLSAKAQKLAGADPGLFERMIAENRAKIEAGKAIVVNPQKDLTAAEKAIRRRIKEAQLAAKGKTLPPDTFQLIYADPEWPDETWSDKGMDRSAANHYPLSDLASIKARPVATIAAKDCVLFLWCTGRHVAIGSHVEVMRFWGFTPRAMLTWDKVTVGTGRWFRNRAEYLIVGVKGTMPAPVPGTQWDDIVAERRDPVHSRKPDFAYELIETYFPTLKKIELNARIRRPGWEAWGYEAPTDEECPERESGTAREAPGGQPLPGNGDIGGLSNGVATPAQDGAEPAPQPILNEAAEVATADPQRSAEGSAASPPVAFLPPMTREEAEPVLREHYASKSATELSVMLRGVPVGTIRTWAFRFQLTDKQRIRDMAIERNTAGAAS